MKKKIFVVHHHKNFSGAARSMGELILSLKNNQLKFLLDLNLKKILIFLLLLILVFNPTEIGLITRLAMANAYLSVSVYVAITLFIFLSFEKSKKYSLSNFLKIMKNCKYQSRLF